jgi:TRAP-type C4-dicarboxylate transport system permease small subunit
MTVVSSYYMVIVVCLPLAFVERADAHISVDVITNLFSKSVQTKLFGWIYLLSAAVFALVAYSSWDEAVSKYNLGQISVERGFAIPTWVGYFAVPLGFGMGTIYAVLRFVQFLIGRPQGPVAGDVDSQVEKLSYD